MAIKCDFCDAPAGLHICSKCYHIAKQLLETYEAQIKKEETVTPISLKEKLPKEKKRGRPPKKKTVPVEEKPKTKILPVEEKPKDPILSKCWSCEFSILARDGGVACTEDKKPESCGHK
jgi:hypothetical protein